MFLMVSANDLILFYLGLELQSLSLYILAAIDRDNLRSSESGVKYFVLSALSSGLLLYGCSLLYGFTGSTNFDVISNQMNSENTGAIFSMVFVKHTFFTDSKWCFFSNKRAKKTTLVKRAQTARGQPTHSTTRPRPRLLCACGG